jgi:hypothetical protein
MFYSKSFLIVIAFFFSLIAATPVSVPDDAAVSEDTRNWTYRDIYNYAVGKGGANDTTAHIIADHVNQTGRNWEDTYRNDITWNNATLTLSHHVATLKERQLPGTYLTGFPWVANCNDAVSWTWFPITLWQCYSYWIGGSPYRMYSIYAITNARTLWLYRDSNTCNYGQSVKYSYAHGCYSSQTGQGFMGAQVQP